MKKITRLITSLALLIGLTVFAAAPAFADEVDVFKGDACTGNTSICGSSGNEAYQILENVINILLTIIGIIAVIMIIIGGIKYVTSTGDSSSINSARETIIYALVGLGIAIMAYALVNFVIGRI